MRVFLPTARVLPCRPIAAFVQLRVGQGVVTPAPGEPLPGAAILATGTTKGQVPVSSAVSNYLKLYRDLIPTVLKTEDLSRPYLSSSPSVDFEDMAGSQTTGDMHYWDV